MACGEVGLTDMTRVVVMAGPQVYLYGTEALGYDLSLKSALHAAGANFNTPRR